MAQFIEVARGLHRLPLLPLDGLNVYLMGDVLVDAGMPTSGRRIARALEGRNVASHALTHCHPDHQGSTRALCRGLGIPLWCGEPDRAAVESGDQTLVFRDPSSFFARMADRLSGPGHHVDRTLQDGDAVADFEVVETPGHTPGHVAFWRAADRVLVLGDVLFNRSPLTLRKGLTEPMNAATWDPAVNRESARRLAALEPRVICFGHGPVLRDPEAFQAAVAALPD